MSLENLPGERLQRSHTPNHGNSIFSRLPNELIYHIFEISLASDSSRQTCLSLCLVASWTRDLALPHLLYTLVLTDGRNPLVMNSRSLEWSFCPEKSGQLVRNVWCTGREGSVSVIIALMQLCPGIIKLSINGDDFCRIIMGIIGRPHNVHEIDDGSGNAAVRNHIRVLASTGMSCTPRELHFHPNSKIPVFNSILSFSRRSFRCAWSSVAADFLEGIMKMFLPPVDYRLVDRFMQMLPCLTHLAVPYTSTNFNQLSSLNPLLRLPSLQMLVLAIATDRYTTFARWFAECWVRNARVYGSRVFLVQYETDIDTARIQWEEDMRVGGSVWERAIQYTEVWEMAR